MYKVKNKEGESQAAHRLLQLAHAWRSFQHLAAPYRYTQGARKGLQNLKMESLSTSTTTWIKVVEVINQGKAKEISVWLERPKTSQKWKRWSSGGRTGMKETKTLAMAFSFSWRLDSSQTKTTFPRVGKQAGNMQSCLCPPHGGQSTVATWGAPQATLGYWHLTIWLEWRCPQGFFSYAVGADPMMQASFFPTVKYNQIKLNITPGHSPLNVNFLVIY